MPRQPKNIQLGDNDPTLAQAFGAALRTRRQELGLLQADLDNGGTITQAYISAFELGKRLPNLEHIVDLAAKLDMPPEELFGEALKLYRKRSTRK